VQVGGQARQRAKAGLRPVKQAGQRAAKMGLLKAGELGLPRAGESRRPVGRTLHWSTGPGAHLHARAMAHRRVWPQVGSWKGEFVF
jgi:hypothetical protein